LLNKIISACEDKNLIYFKIEDLGKTQLDPFTLTCVGIGPHSPDDIDGITKDLKLL
jgi:PTH2 family peptidyl-tRNA hydrolase